MASYTIKSIGVIHTPYQEPKDIPIQGRFRSNVQGKLILEPEYVNGLKDLDKFSHCYLIYYFHRSAKESILGKPFLEDERHGIFSIRSPHRVNHIGISIVKIERIEDNTLFFTEVDMLNGTPLLDIKPYIRFFDERPGSKAGWVEKHFQDGDIPDRVILE